MQLSELATLADQVLRYAPESDLTGTIADALRGEAALKLWQTSKKWYRQKVADLDVPVNATLQRAIRRSYLTSLGQTCDQAIAFIRTYQAESESMTGYRARLQALYHKLQRALPVLLTFPVSDEAYQIQLIESIRTHLSREIERVATQETLPDNPADAVFDQLLLWDYTLELNEKQLLLQDEVHRFVLDELRITRGLEVPNALEVFLLEGWMYEGQHQTFFDLMCRNFSEEIRHSEGISEIFNAKLLAMLHEQMTAVVEGMQRMEGQLTTLPKEVAKEVVARIPTINFDIHQKHHSLNVQIKVLNDNFAEKTQRKQKYEQRLAVAVLDDEEIRELLTETIKELDKELLNFDQQRTKLQKELDQFEDNVRTLALILYDTSNPDSPRLKEARILFEQGNLEEANLVLNPKELERDKALVEKADAFLKQKKQTLAQEYLTKAGFIALVKSTPNWFHEACHYYNEALVINESYNTCFGVARFLAEHNQHQQAIQCYELALKYVEDDAQKALTLNNMANLRANTQQLDQAEEEYTEALRIRRALALGDPRAYLPDVAMTLNNIAVLHADTQQLAQAEVEYAETLDIYRYLALVDPNAYVPYVASTLNNIAIFHQRMQKLAPAEIEYIEALNIRRILASANPDVYMPDIATTLNNLAALHAYTQQSVVAETEYNEALDIRRTLASVNPDTYLPYVTDTLNNLANLHNNMHQFTQAEAEHAEALDIRRTLASVNPDVYLPRVADTLNNLAVLHAEMKQLDRAETEHDEALSIRRTLATVNPDVYMPLVADTLNNLGTVHSDMQQMEQAEAKYTEALVIRRTLASINPDTYMPFVAQTLHNLANLHSILQELARAEIEYAEALDIRRTLASINPDAHLSDVADTLNNLAALHLKTLQVARAETEYIEALEIYKILSEKNPLSFQIFFAMALINLGLFFQNNIPNKEKSLDYSLQAYTNAETYRAEVPFAKRVCDAAIKVWKAWGKDLLNYLKGGQGEE